MARKKDHHNSSSDRKQKAPSASPEDMTQAQQQLADYPQIAAALRESSGSAQAESALTAITVLPEGAQMALLKMLARENTTDAADVLAALNAYSPVKEIRKEARRGLIQLEGTRTYPGWSPPTVVPAFSNRSLELSTSPVRFWQGLMTDSRDTGQMQLILCWEEENGKDATMLGFLLEFWRDGVKDFFMHSGNKRKIDAQIAETQDQFTRFGDVSMLDCSLEEGTRLIQEALAVNKRFDTKPHLDYRRNIAQIRRLIPELDEPSEPQSLQNLLGFPGLSSLFDEIDMLGLQAEDTVEEFLDAWGHEDYHVAYELLANDSAIQAGLSAEEWIERRSAWAEQAHPANVEFTVVSLAGEPEDEDEFEDDGDDELAEDEEELADGDDELANDEEEFEVVAEAEPASTTDAAMHPPQEVEVFWSLEMSAAPSGQELPELPMATAVFARTGRHWFWTKYTVVWDEEQGERRIQNMTDEWAAVLHLPEAEIESRLNEVAQRIQVLTHELQQAGSDEEEPDDEDEMDVLDEEGGDADLEEADNEFDEADLDDDDDDDDDDDEADAGFLAGLFDETGRDETLREIMENTRRSLAYCDALIAQSPSERSLYEPAQLQAVLVQDWARVAAYLDQIAECFPEERGTALRTMAVMLATVAAEHAEQSLESEGERLLELAETVVRDSLAAEDAVMGHTMLAQILLARETNYAEAERELRRAQELATSPKDEESVELSLGILAERQEASQEALRHYQRVAELNPEYASIWFYIGRLQRELGQYDEAEAHLKRAIEAKAQEIEAYLHLAAMYTEQGKLKQAHAVLDQGLEIDPEAADLLAQRALVYINEGDYRQAREPLQEAESLDPDLEIVQAARALYNAGKREQPGKRRRPKSKRH
ncbi:MAG: tetratricopeptide repeat protein [Chloroflexota bacterium]|nr:tetratricopeptide repeat protein [Chloroflexota bacterium]